MVSLNATLPQLQLFFLVFLRVGAILMSIPIFDSRGIPFLFKIALAFATGIILFPLLKLDEVPMASDLISLSISVAGEIFLGRLTVKDFSSHSLIEMTSMLEESANPSIPPFLLTGHCFFNFFR